MGVGEKPNRGASREVVWGGEIKGSRSAVGEEGKKRGQTAKISRSEAGRAVDWGANFARRYFLLFDPDFAFFPSLRTLVQARRRLICA